MNYDIFTTSYFTLTPDRRTYNKAALTAVVTNTAPPPNVAMRVLDRTGRDARAVGLGEELTLKIELREATSKRAN